MNECKITAVAYEGMGISHLEGKVVFVPGVITDDVVKVKIEKDNKKYSIAEVIEFVKKSEFRNKPSCPVFGTCGGCQWLGVDKNYQQETKVNFVKDALQKIAGIKKEQEINFVPSSELENYRSRILLRGRVDEKGIVTVGFFRKKSYEIVAINNCSLASPLLNKIILQLTHVKLKSLKNIKFRVELQELGQEKVSALFSFLDNHKTNKQLIDQAQEIPQVGWAGTKDHKKKLALFEQDNNISYFSLPGVFQQINIKQNQKLRKQVYDLITVDSSVKNILDLYCGSGNLSLQFAKKGLKVTGVEVAKNSIVAANYNLKSNSIKNAEYKAQSVYSFLRESNKKYDCVIIDPPRKGLEQREVECLLKLGAKKMIYISCNPSTWARDLKKLLPKYSLDNVTAYDFLPNTYHVEVLSVLTRL